MVLDAKDSLPSRGWKGGKVKRCKYVQANNATLSNGRKFGGTAIENQCYLINLKMDSTHSGVGQFDNPSIKRWSDVTRVEIVLQLVKSCKAKRTLFWAGYGS
jgi:hypothetical protein